MKTLRSATRVLTVCVVALSFLLAEIASAQQEASGSLQLKEFAELSGHQSASGVSIRALALSQDGSRAAYVPEWSNNSRTNAHPPVVWNLQTGRQIGRLGGTAEGGALCLAMSRSGRFVACEGSRGVFWWNIEAREAPTKLIATREKFSVRGISFSHNEKMVAGSHSSDQLFVWELASGRQLQALDGAGGLTCFSPDDSTLAAATPELEVKIWDLSKPGFPKRLKFDDAVPRTGAIAGARAGSQRVNAWVRSLAYSKDGASISAIGGLAGKPFHFHRWNIGTNELQSMQTVGRNPNAAAFLPGENQAVLGDADGTVGIWDLSNGKLISETKSHAKAVTGVAVSADGKTVVSGGADLKAFVFRVSN